MAIADRFAALNEMRPFRAAMDREQVLSVLNEDVKSGGIDGDLVALLAECYGQIDRIREAAVRAEGARYYETVTKEEITGLKETAARAETAGYNAFITQDGITGIQKEMFFSYEGALDVEYEQFAKQYQYISNLEKRFSHPFKLIVISLDAREGKEVRPEELEQDMFYMEQAIRRTVRNVDVMTRYGKQQFLVILLGTGEDGAEIAVERIFKDYEKMNEGSVSIPSYLIAET